MDMYVNLTTSIPMDWSITCEKIDRSLEVFFSYPYQGQRYLYVFSFDVAPEWSSLIQTPLYKYMKRYLKEAPIPIGGDIDEYSDTSPARQFVYLTNSILPGYDDRISSITVDIDGGSIYFARLSSSKLQKDGFVIKVRKTKSLIEN